MSSVRDVQKEIRNQGFSSARWQALMLRCADVCRQGPTGPILTLEPWRDCLPPDLHGFLAWASSTMELLDSIISEVVSA